MIAAVLVRINVPAAWWIAEIEDNHAARADADTQFPHVTGWAAFARMDDVLRISAEIVRQARRQREWVAA